MLYSYLPFLVRFLLTDIATVEVGYWSALLGFAYNFGALLGNLMWGYAADKVGRRPVLLMGVMGSGVMSCVFGFSSSYWLSVLLRLLWGLLNTVGVGRTMIVEILDDSNSAQGMVLFSVVSGLGRIIGPLIGGFAARPALHLHIFHNTIFETFPFALPSLLSLFLSVVVCMLAYNQLEETLPPQRLKALSTLCLCGVSDNTYSILGDNALEDNELDISVSPERLDEYSSTSPFLSKHTTQNNVVMENGIELKPSGLSLTENFNDESDNDNENHADSTTPRMRKKKGVTFNSYVQLKIIDTSDIQYQKLKKVSAEDKPMYYSADERNSDYNRSVSYIEALQDGRVIENDFDEDNDLDMDASSRSLCSNDTFLDGNDVKIQKYSNGSELFPTQEMIKDFSEMGLWGIIRVLVRSRLIYYTVMTYFLLVMGYSTLNEIYPLWVVVPSSSGGFGFNDFMLGLSLFCSGPISLFMQLCIFPAAVHHNGLLPLIRSCMLGFSLLATITPAICIPILHRVILIPQILVILSFSALTVFADWSLVITYVFINNSCYGYQRATVNGFSQAVACFAMMMASLLGSSFFALCESNSFKDQLPWPFHYAIVFWMIALIANSARLTTFSLHRKIQKSRREPRFPRYAIQMENFSANNSNSFDIVDDNNDVNHV